MLTNRHKLKLKAGLASRRRRLAALALTAPSGASAACSSGGLTPAAENDCAPTAKARLLSNGMLIPPQAPPLGSRR